MSEEEQSNDKQPTPSSLTSFWKELRRRKVFRVAAVYAVVGWLIIQVANATFEDFGIPVWAYRFVVLMVVLGFPIALVCAWAFELTPEGITTSRTARERQANSPVPAEHHKRRNWLAYLVGAAVPTLIFGVASTIFYFTAREPATEAQSVSRSVGKSIAVLPFDNRSNREEDQYFTDGIHDDLLTHISHIREIKTISRTSVMGYRDTTKNMRTIGEELGVATILEGGVQRAGDQVRINVQLIDAVMSVMNIARALIATGERQQADYLLDQLTEILEARPENIWTWRFRVQVPAIKGEQAEAMRAIHQYVAITGVPSDDLYSSVELEPLRSLPEFQAVFGDVIGKRKEQFEHLRAMEANGELAPIPELPAD